MSNPYQSPLSEQFYSQAKQSVEAARQSAIQSVQAPAIALMVVSGVSIAAVSLSVLFNVVLLATGAAANFNRGGMDPFVYVAIRLCWALLILAASGYCLFGAWQMKTLNNYQHAFYSSIVAMIPCLGPCCVLGIPFGAWAMTTLYKDEVRQRFQT
jgi:hypothetical protein